MIRLYKGLATDIVVPAQLKGLPVTEIYEKVFYPDVKDLTEEQKTARRHIHSIAFTEGIKRLNEKMFLHCSEIKSICFPESLEKICDLSGIPADTDLQIPTKYFEVKYAFSGQEIERFSVPEGVVSIGESAFSWCKELRSVTLPQSLKTIEKDAFCGCKKLHSISFHEGLTSIAYGAFTWCKMLTSVTIPKSVSFIDKFAFSFSNPQICAPAGSYAEQYAKENGMRFKAI